MPKAFTVIDDSLPFKAAVQIIDCFKNGGKVLICGNGGSAAMSQHMAAELAGKFEHNRRALPAISLTTDTSILTAIANDFGFEHVFSRQVEGLGQEGDVLIGFSTSGKSKNVIAAMDIAGLRKMQIIDVPREGDTTAHIQEYQFKWMHDVCRIVEKAFL